MNYWEECISEALSDVGIIATQKQIENIASWVEGAHENYAMDTGLDDIEYIRSDVVKKEIDDRLKLCQLWCIYEAFSGGGSEADYMIEDNNLNNIETLNLAIKEGLPDFIIDLITESLSK